MKYPTKVLTQALLYVNKRIEYYIQQKALAPDKLYYQDRIDQYTQDKNDLIQFIAISEKYYEQEI